MLRLEEFEKELRSLETQYVIKKLERMKRDGWYYAIEEDTLEEVSN